MEYYELSEYKDRCQHWLSAIRSCRLCLFNTLCNLEKNTQKYLPRNEEEWKKQSWLNETDAIVAEQ